MPTLKASEPGLTRIQQTRNETGWTIDDEGWLLEASQILKPQEKWLPGGPYASGCSQETWKRFLRGTPIGTAAFKAFCQVLKLNWQEIVDRPDPPPPAPHRRIDWDGAPDVSVFYGRASELATLQQWIVSVSEARTRLVALWGIAGIGKTALAVKLTQQIQGDFEFVIWRSLSIAPKIEELLTDLLGFLSNRQETQANLSRLLDYLRTHRCLIVLDGVEAIFGPGQLAGNYRDGYHEYGKLFRQIGESQHQSCLVLTSSERPTEIALLEGNTGPVRSLHLTGLDKQAAREILRNKGLSEDKTWDHLIQLYRGNPFSLAIISLTILDLYDGKVANFVNQNTVFVGKIDKILKQPIDRLSEREIEIMGSLAIARSPRSISKLLMEMSSPVSTSQLMEAVESLRERSLIEKITGSSDEALFTLQPVVMKYIINRFKIEQKT